MSESSQSTASRTKAKASGGASASPFDFPKFEIPAFDIPQMEIPKAFREFAEQSVSQAKESYARMKSAAEQATEVLEGSYATASKGASDCGLMMMEATRVNSNAAFDFYAQMFALKSFSELVELSTTHARQQFETVADQTKELAALAQKVMTEAAEPVKDSVTKAFKKAV